MRERLETPQSDGADVRVLEAALAGLIVVWAERERRKRRPLTIDQTIERLRREARVVSIAGVRPSPEHTRRMEGGAEWLSRVRMMLPE